MRSSRLFFIPFFWSHSLTWIRRSCLTNRVSRLCSSYFWGTWEKMILIPGKREIMGLLLNEHEFKGQAKLIQGGMQKYFQDPSHVRLNP